MDQEKLSMSELELMDMERREILGLVDRVIDEIEDLIFRHNYYADPITAVKIEPVVRDLRKIVKDFGTL